ncbi:uncharacterized protein F5Z01DRAFT_649990 [Emericellopsis atlantica]|uniref:Uncharacterized protein n=1 Tax=Emericellopsis atlantica TaxID=2614577 RepID=A0A9P7ZQR5_9HYPO|nr:uncharacterized protein F5Z01DRAFT_649990 [Emericellopsis atlantica]KAG9256376.1 hypothetical protein F5Z01DRAFT_649990 [Emericellopsis atlantica]
MQLVVVTAVVSRCYLSDPLSKQLASFASKVRSLIIVLLWSVILWSLSALPDCIRLDYGSVGVAHSGAGRHFEERPSISSPGHQDILRIYADFRSHDCVL